MSKLDDFLSLDDVSEVHETIKEVVNGKELEFVIRPVTQEEHKEFQKRSQNWSKNKVSFDNGKYTSLLLSSCIVEPNFRSEEFLKKAKCNAADEFLNKKFPAGVLNDISQKIQKLSGFESLEMEIENAKN